MFKLSKRGSCTFVANQYQTSLKIQIKLLSMTSFTISVVFLQSPEANYFLEAVQKQSCKIHFCQSIELGYALIQLYLIGTFVWALIKRHTVNPANGSKDHFSAAFLKNLRVHLSPMP